MVIGQGRRLDAITVLVVGAGGVIGANARWAIGEWSTNVWSTAFPWGTLLVNLSGSLILGWFIAVSVRRERGQYARLLIATGMLGAYTTFSTFAYETVRLVQRGDDLVAVTYVVASLVLGLGAAALGIRLGKSV